MTPQDLKDQAARLLHAAAEDEKQVRELLTRIKATRNVARDLQKAARVLAALQPAEETTDFLGGL